MDKFSKMNDDYDNRLLDDYLKETYDDEDDEYRSEINRIAIEEKLFYEKFYESFC